MYLRIISYLYELTDFLSTIKILNSQQVSFFFLFPSFEGRNQELDCKMHAQINFFIIEMTDMKAYDRTKRMFFWTFRTNVLKEKANTNGDIRGNFVDSLFWRRIYSL